MIRIPEIRLVDEEGNQVGIVATAVAQQMAQERGLDLVEVSPNARPPVCKIMDYGRYKYEASKKAKAAKKKQHQAALKEVQFRPKIDDHDYQFKVRNILRFLQNKDKVKVVLRFKGREMSHMDVGMRTLDRILEDLEGLAQVEHAAKQEGRSIVMVLAPISGKKVKQAPKEKQAQEESEQTPQPQEAEATEESQ